MHQEEPEPVDRLMFLILRGHEECPMCLSSSGRFRLVGAMVLCEGILQHRATVRSRAVVFSNGKCFVYPTMQALVIRFLMMDHFLISLNRFRPLQLLEPQRPSRINKNLKYFLGTAPPPHHRLRRHLRCQDSLRTTSFRPFLLGERF